MTTKKRTRKLMVITLALALVFSMTAAVFAATITLSTDSVRLKVAYPGQPAKSTVTVRSSETAWGVSLTKKPTNGSGVSITQNRMTSFSIVAAANATPGAYEATVSSGGSKKIVKITVIKQ